MTVKDIIDLNPYCNVYINSNTDFVKLYKNPDNYIISDMKVCDGGLELLVYPKGGFSMKYDKSGRVSAGLKLSEFYPNTGFEINDIDDIDEDD